ncbi:MAG: phosphate ABC transporter permease PtsA [Gemmatimonadetes bacterium]|nr:MAG: phosphate ABC transporter permease PtsA [Gemmatimonadota bacterium]
MTGLSESHPLQRPLSRRRRLAGAISATLVWVAVAVAVIPLLLVMFTVVKKGGSLITPRFLTDDLPIQARSAEGGVGPAVTGTLLITGVASLIAIPIGILAAIYLTEYGGTNRLARVIRFLSDVMAGVPSIVMGLFIFTVWVVRYQQRSGLAGSLALACLMLPIVIRSSEAMIRLVPNELREASYALGSRKARTVLTVVLPAALPGVVSGCLLAVARAAGETAPLLFTIGLTYSKNLKLSGENTALSAQIFSNASTSFVAAQQRAWAAALTLIVIVLILSVVARVVAARFTVR